MKLPFLLFFAAAATFAAAPPAPERLVMVAPFDNLSSVRRYIEYEVDTGAVTGNPRKQYRVDRYCHAGREHLEDIVTTFPGLRPVERAQFDRVMLEVSGAVRDGAVDPEKARHVAIQLGADAILMGTILDLRESTSVYAGYTRLTETLYTATIRVRLINLEEDSASKRINAAVVASYKVRGQYITAGTPYLSTRTSDPFYLAISDALTKLESDADFRARFTKGRRVDPGFVDVHFEVSPTNSSVSLKGTSGWLYLGGTPLSHKLPTGTEVPIRIEKHGYATWESLINPRAEFRVTHELKPLGAAEAREFAGPPHVSKEKQ